DLERVARRHAKPVRVEPVAQLVGEDLADAVGDRLDPDAGEHRVELGGAIGVEGTEAATGETGQRERGNGGGHGSPGPCARGSHLAPHTTTLTIRLGTTITFRGARPSSALATGARASAADSASLAAASRGRSTVPRSLPLTWTATVTFGSTISVGSNFGQ